MCKQLVVLWSVVLLLSSFLFSLPVSAADLSEDDAYRYYNSLRSITDYYNLDTSASTGEQDICYYYGACAAENYVVSCLWIGYDVYRYVYYPATGDYSFYRDSKMCNYYNAYIGHPYVTEFYYDASDSQVQLLAGQTNNRLIYDNVSARTDSITFSELDTLDDLFTVIKPPEESTGVDLSGVENGIASLPGKIGDVFQGIIDGLLNGIKTFFTELFMPDTEAIAEEWEFIQSKFQFWVDVRDFVEEITASIAAMDGSTPDVIEFQLKTSGTKWFGGLSGSVVVVDLSWFATYRDSVHVIISAFIWLAYIWRLFHALPGIIAGVQGSAPMDKETARSAAGGVSYDK